METSMNNRFYHPSSAPFTQGLATKPSTSFGQSTSSTSCCTGSTTTSLCCSSPCLPSTSITAHSETPVGSSASLDCTSSSTPPQPICITRIYPSPPLTGSALKKSVPLPEVNGEPVMGPACHSDPRSFDSDAMSHDAPSVAPPQPQSALEPLSPPATVAVATQELPVDDLQTEPLFPTVRLSGPRLPSPTDDETPLPPSKRARRERPAIFADSPPEHTPHSPASSWSYRSDASGSSSSHSFYDHDSSPGSWGTDSTETDYSLSFHDLPPPSSPRPKTSSLDLPPLPGFAPPYSDGSDAYLPSSNGPKSFGSGLLWYAPTHDHYDFDMETNSPSQPPPSPRVKFLHAPLTEEPELDLPYTDTIMPAEDEDDATPPVAPPPLGDFQSLPDYTTHDDLVYLTPAPRSPHTHVSDLPDFDMDDVFEAPSSPHSPHSDLPELADDELYPSFPPGTISPSLLSPAPETPNEGLGLFIQADPPLRRSPSPEDDALQFLDVQFDPTISNLDVDEFLALRGLRRRALDAERDARMRETVFTERVATAATALLPSSLAEAGVSDDLAEKRLRKHELYVAMDLRNEARKDRKREKQLSKEIGTLLDIKMNGSFGGEPAGGSVRQLVASMMMRRQEASRSLANRKSAATPRPYVRSSLSCCTSCGAAE